MSFSKLGLHPAVCAPLARLGYETPTPIQTKAIPFVLTRRRPAGARANGHRQDGCVRPADDRAPRENPARRRAQGAPRARPRADERTRAAGASRPVDVRARPRISASPRSSAACHGCADPGATQRHRHRRRHARPPHRSSAAADNRSRPRSKCSRSTKPIECWTWGSCRRCGASCAALPRRARRCCSRRRCRMRSCGSRGDFTQDAARDGRLGRAGRRPDRDPPRPSRRPGRQARLLSARAHGTRRGQALVFCRTKRGANRVGEYLRTAA